jgi:hypothetical protein
MHSWIVPSLFVLFEYVVFQSIQLVPVVVMYHSHSVDLVHLDVVHDAAQWTKAMASVVAIVVVELDYSMFAPSQLVWQPT